MFSTECKADAVKLWRESGDSREEVAKRLGISGATLGKWIEQAKVDNGEREGLRKQNKVLQMKRDLMKKQPPSLQRTRQGEDLLVHRHREGQLPGP